MIKSILLFSLLALSPMAVFAAVLRPLPLCSLGNGYDANNDGTIDSGCPGADHFSAATVGYAANAKDASIITPMATTADATSASGTYVGSPLNSTPFAGQIRVQGTFTNASYFLDVRARTLNSTKVVWIKVGSPFTNAPDNTTEGTALTITDTFQWSQTFAGYSYLTGQNSATRKTHTLNGQQSIYILAEPGVDIDCIHVHTGASDANECPSGMTPSTPDYVAFKVTGAEPASCANMANANVVSFASGFNSSPDTAPEIRVAWKSGAFFICNTAFDASKQTVAASNDDDAIFEGGDDYTEVRLSDSLTPQIAGSYLYAVNAAGIHWDASYPAGVETKSHNATWACSSSGTWSVFCKISGIGPTLSDDLLGRIQILHGDKDSGSAFTYTIMGGTSPTGVNNPLNFKIIQYSSTALPVSADTTPPANASSIVASSIGSNTFTVSWTATDASYPESCIVNYGLTTDYEIARVTGSPSGDGNCVVVVPGLTPGTDYHYELVNVDAVGNSNGNTTVDQEVSTTGGAVAGFYIATNGTGSKAGTSCADTNAASRCPISQLVNALAGETWILHNGTYSASGSVISLDGNSGAHNGTSSSHIRVTAIDPANCTSTATCPVLQGDGSAGHVLRIQNLSWWDFDNIVVRNADNAGNTGSNASMMGTYQSSNLTFRKMVFADNNTWGNNDGVVLQGTNILLEDSDVLRSHRNFIACYPGSTSGITLRRIYVGQFVPHHGTDYGPGDGVVMYSCHDSKIENSIAEGVAGDGGFTGWGDNNSNTGSIAIGNSGSALFNGTSSSIPSDEGDNFTLKDFIGINSGNEVCVYLRPPHATVTGLSCFNTVLRADSDHIDGGTANLTVTNALAQNTVSSGFFLSESPIAFDTKVLRFSRAYLTGGISGGWTQSNNSTSDPSMGSCRVWVPTGSNLKGAGQGGADIGANVIFATIDGVLTSQKLWNSSTGKMRFGPPVVTGVNSSSTGLVRDTVGTRLNITASGCLPAGY